MGEHHVWCDQLLYWVEGLLALCGPIPSFSLLQESIKVFKIAVVSTRGVFGMVSLYVSKGSVDIAEPVSSSIFSVWPLTFGFTQMTSPTTPWLTLLTSRDATKLSSSRSSSTSNEWRLGFSSLRLRVEFWLFPERHTLWIWPNFPHFRHVSFLK